MGSTAEGVGFSGTRKRAGGEPGPLDPLATQFSGFGKIDEVLVPLRKAVQELQA